MKNKNCICHTSYLRNSVAYDHMTMGFVTLPQNDDMSWGFFSFFQNFDFRVARRVKGQKMVQNEKNIQSVALHISGSIYHDVICGTQV